MDDESTLDELTIQHQIYAWGYARDNGDWDLLQDLFCEKSTINITWMHAAGREFVERSKDMTAKRRPGTHLKHIFSSPYVRVSGPRAFSICHAMTESRDAIEGHAIDLSAWFRMFDLWRKETDGTWRIYRRTAIYEKDCIRAVDPRGLPPELFGDMDLTGYPASTQYLSWYLTRLGMTPRLDIISVHTPEEEAVKRDGIAWLAGEDV